MSGWAGGLLDGWMSGWADGWVGEWAGGLLDGLCVLHIHRGRGHSKLSV